MAHPPWVIGNLIQPRYLDTLQELLSDWSDNVLLQASGAAVIVPGSPSAPAELVIDGQMRTSQVQHVATVAGASGIYGVWAETTTGATSFSVAVATTQPVAQHVRTLGTVAFNGSQVVEVSPAAREENVSHIYGHAPSESAAANALPAARADGSLDPSWLGNLDSGEVPVGGVREVWVPSGVAYTAPTGWHLLDGTVLGPAQHSFAGVATISLPDMRNRQSLGANPANVYGSSGNDSGTAPGVNGVGGDQTARAFPHAHADAGHAHTLAGHTHDGSHTHTFPNHHHHIDHFVHVFRGVTAHLATSALNFGYQGIDGGVGAGRTAETSVPVNSDLAVTGAAAAAVVAGGPGAVASSAPAVVDTRPWNLGLAYVMRVQ